LQNQLFCCEQTNQNSVRRILQNRELMKHYNSKYLCNEISAFNFLVQIAIGALPILFLQDSAIFSDDLLNIFFV